MAEHSADPDKDVKLRLTTPPDMIANLKAGNIDGFFGPEPFNQRAVWDKAGYIHTLSRDIWNGHPVVHLVHHKALLMKITRLLLAMNRAIIKANVMANDRTDTSWAFNVIVTTKLLKSARIGTASITHGSVLPMALNTCKTTQTA